MEYASGGELFERIRNAGRFSEDEARFFFQQLVSGVSYRHAMVNKRVYCFQKAKSNVVPEVLKKEYDGKIADVWSCGVTLYFMLVGAYPFEDPDEPKNFCRTIHRILNLQYSIPDYIHISPECHHLISRIFTADPAKRITMAEIRNHEWFLKNLPVDLVDENTTSSQFKEPDQPAQSVDEVMQIIAEGTIPAAGANSLNQNLTESLDIDGDDVDEDLETDPDLEVDSSWEIVYAQ